MSVPSSRGARRLWPLLAVLPVAFLILIVGASVAVSLAGETDPDAVAQAVVGTTPWLLVGVQLVILGLTGLALRREGLGWRSLPWRPPEGRPLGTEVAIGAAAGVVLAGAYLAVLSPWTVWAQEHLGDYVPPGELLPTLGSALVPFFIANVVLAPFAKESLYRGYALPRLTARHRTWVAITISCVWFGLLHWSGGLWYVLLTGIVAGGLFAGLFVLRRNLVVTFAAHLALNLVEFVYVALTVAR